MSWYAVAVAGATLVSGMMGADSARRSARASAKERRRAARESLLTAKFNINERNKESRQAQYETLDTGGNLMQKIAVAGKQAEGTATVSAGTSGAVVGSGSSRAAIESIVKQSLVAQTEVLLDTKHRIKAIQRDTENINKSEWRNAKLNQAQQNRVASTTEKSADRERDAGYLQAGVSAAGSYFSMKGSPTSNPKTPQTGTGSQHLRNPVKIKSTSASTSSIYQNRNWQYKDMMKRRGKEYKLPWQ